MVETRSPSLQTVLKGMSNNPTIKGILKECARWPGKEPLKRHNDAKLLIHKINLLADLGFSQKNTAIKSIIKKILATRHPDGPFQIDILIPKVFGGSGKPERGWMLCDAPLVLNALLALGIPETNPWVQKSLDHLVGLVKNNGFPCAAYLPKLRGPGKKEDPCPYATLVALRAISHSNIYKRSDVCKIGTETLLTHWERQKEKKIRMFGIGTDFRKLKYPFIWYDILHVVDVLSRFAWCHQDTRFQEMLQIILSKANQDGTYTPESVWMAYKGLDCAQKKQPSDIMTTMIHRIKSRLGK